MKYLTFVLLGLVLVFVCAATPANAAVAQLSCTGASATFTVNLSFFDLGVTIPTAPGGGSSGSGSGKPVFPPLDIHSALSNFTQFFQIAAKGTVLESCTLTSSVGGQTSEFIIHGVTVASVDAIVRGPKTTDDKPASFMDAKLSFTSLEVIISSGTDDGGTPATAAAPN